MISVKAGDVALCKSWCDTLYSILLMDINCPFNDIINKYYVRANR